MRYGYVDWKKFLEPRITSDVIQAVVKTGTDRRVCPIVDYADAGTDRAADDTGVGVAKASRRCKLCLSVCLPAGRSFWESLAVLLLVYG